MIELIKPKIDGYEKIIIPAEKIVMEYLKSQGENFNIVHIDIETLNRLLTLEKLIEIPSKHQGWIAGYTPKKEDDRLLSSSGLKLSSKEHIGTFIIEEKRIIYDVFHRFFEERDCYRYDASIFNTYYTTATMKDLLMDELRWTRDYLIYVGEKILKKTSRCMEMLKPITESELISYLDEDTSKQLYYKIRTKNE